MQLLMHCEPNTASSIQETVNRHKKELEELEEELQGRVKSVATHRVKIEKLQAELALLGTQDLGLKHALASDLSPGILKECDGETSPGVKRSKSELVLRSPREETLEPLSADEREDFRNKRMNLSLSLDPLASPNSTLPSDSFHTATCSPKAFPHSPNTPTAPSGVVNGVQPQFRLGPAPPGDDSDDMSSTEDYHKPRIVEGQSSSSVERSPEECKQKIKYKRRIPGEGRGGRRQVTEAEALRAMQRLCSRIAHQKLLVISSLENDCSKDELDNQIAVLQDLQKKYVRLEMALQYSFFDSKPPRRPVMVTPIQETPSLTLSESDMHVATDPETPPAADPLLSRLKEQEIEGSDNVSTSNDELPSEHSEGWDDPLRRRTDDSRTDDSRTDDSRTECNQIIDVPLPDPAEDPGLSHPIDFNTVVSIPGWVTRGAGASTHHEYEVRICLGESCRWLLLRRYRRFRELYLAMRRTYGPKVASIPFPPRQLWSSEAVARTRRAALESFLRRLLTVCSADARCVLHRAPLTQHSLVAFSPFFRKGVFESGKCGTG